MGPRKRRETKKIQSPRVSLEELSQDFQGGKSRAKNFSAEECLAVIKVCDRYYTIISKNSNRDKDRQEKQKAWDKIKAEYDLYCKSQGIYVSRKHIFHNLFSSIIV